MRRSFWINSLVFGAFAGYLAAGGALRADPESADLLAADHDQTRGVLEKDYVDQYAQRAGIYQSAPITHVVPSLKTVTLAFAGTKLDKTVKDDTFPRGYYAGDLEQSLKITGYHVAPYVAVSLSRIGLGFSAATGEERAFYNLSHKDGSMNYQTRSQTSDMDFKAVGVYAYLLPYASGADRSVLASVVVGAKNYNVNHRVSASLAPGDRDPGAEKFRYNLNEYELGTLVEFKLLKFFSLVPWLDWTYLDVHDPVSQANALVTNTAGHDPSRSEIAQTFKGDVDVFWQARPRLDLGLDLVAKTHGVAVHLGQLLGLLVNARGSDTIVDRSYSLNVSVDLQGD